MSSASRPSSASARRARRWSRRDSRPRRPTCAAQRSPSSSPQTRCELAEVLAALAAGGRRAGLGAARWPRRAPISRSSARSTLPRSTSCKEQTERKEYLDRQFADLNSALETLEEAMRRIDKETRTRFEDTFERINAGLQEKFPRLFGGGHAYLELVGEDKLTAGRRRHGAAARQEEQHHPPAVGRREGADRGGAGVLDLRPEPGAVLPARRGGRAAR